MFYGLLEEILELNYLYGCKVVLFRCKWFKTDNQRCIIKDNITRIATNIEWYKDEQYILATQVNQVFYLQDPSKGQHWKVVQEVNHRKIWDQDIEDIVTEDNDSDVIHENNSSDLALSANLDDLDYTTLSIGEATEVQDTHTLAHNDDDFIHNSDSDTSNSDCDNDDATDTIASDESD